MDSFRGKFSTTVHTSEHVRIHGDILLFEEKKMVTRFTKPLKRIKRKAAIRVLSQFPLIKERKI